MTACRPKSGSSILDRLGVSAIARPRARRHQRRDGPHSHRHRPPRHRARLGPEEVKGWQAYRQKNEEALIARPMTWRPSPGPCFACICRAMRWRGRSPAISAGLCTGRRQGQRGGQIADWRRRSTTPVGQALLAGVAAKAATGLCSVCCRARRSPPRCSVSGVHEITNDADKERVLRLSGVSRHPAKCRLLDPRRARPRADRGRSQARRPHRDANLLQPRHATAHAGQEHGDEICRPALLRHVGAAALPRRDRLPSLCRNGDACQPEEESRVLTLRNLHFRAWGTAVIESRHGLPKRRYGTPEFRA